MKTLLRRWSGPAWLRAGGILCAVVLIQQSCRKMDMTNTDYSKAQQTFLGHNNNSPKMENVVSDFRSHLNESGITAFLRTNGQPLWDNAVTLQNAGDDYEMLIPTRMGNETEVNNFFIVKGHGDKPVGYEMHRKMSMLTGRKEKSQFNFDPGTIRKLKSYINSMTYHPDEIKRFSATNSNKETIDCVPVAQPGVTGYQGLQVYHFEGPDCPGDKDVDWVLLNGQWQQSATYGAGSSSSGSGSSGGAGGSGSGSQTGGSGSNTGGGPASSGGGGTTLPGSGGGASQGPVNTGGPFDPFGWGTGGDGPIIGNDPCASVPWWELCDGTGGNTQDPEPDVPTMLHNYAVAIKTASETMFNIANLNHVEWCMIIVKDPIGSIIAKNQQTSGRPSFVVFDFSLSPGETLMGEEHTHESDPPNPGQVPPQSELDRPAPDFSDLGCMRGRPRYYFQFVNCGNVRYAFVIEDKTKADAFFVQHRLKNDSYQDDAQKADALGMATWNTNWQGSLEKALLNMLSGSTTSPESASTIGIGIYKSNNPPDNSNFIKLN